MTDTIKLEYYLKKAGITKRMYAEALGISVQGLYNKLNNVSEFKQAEIVITCELLGLDNKTRDEIFFAFRVDDKSTA